MTLGPRLRRRGFTLEGRLTAAPGDANLKHLLSLRHDRRPTTFHATERRRDAGRHSRGQMTTASATTTATLTINGERRTVAFPTHHTLLEVLREAESSSKSPA